MSVKKSSGMQSVPGANYLPIVLCFHGAGTNRVIFQLQTRKIVQSLKNLFRFVFLDSPFESPPGPGVVGTARHLGPFFRWQCDYSAVAGFDISVDEVGQERLAVRTMLLDTMNEYGRENVVGVMAFSQGTRVATGFCWDQELGNNIRFAILMSGTFPILPLGDDLASINSPIFTVTTPSNANSDGALSSITDSSDLTVSEPGDLKTANLDTIGIQSNGVHQSCQQRLQIPSIHIQGVRDPWLSQGDRLRQTYYDEAKATVIQFDGAHEVPAAPRNVSEIVKAIIQVWTVHLKQENVAESIPNSHV